MLNTRFLSSTDQKCADSSTYWQFFHYRSPGVLRYTAGPIAKILCKNSRYIYIEREIEWDRQTDKETDRERYINPLNIRYIFSRSTGNTENHVATSTFLEWMGILKLVFISSTWDCTTFHNFLPMFKKKKGLWKVGRSMIGGRSG